MQDQGESSERSTAVEIADLRSQRRRKVVIAFAIVVVIAMGSAGAWLFLKPDPCDEFAKELCDRAALGNQWPALRKSLSIMGATPEQCRDIVEAGQQVPPEMKFRFYTHALISIVEDTIEDHRRAGREPPENLIQLKRNFEKTLNRDFGGSIP